MSTTTRPVVGIDIGTATVAAGYADTDGTPHPLAIRTHAGKVAHYRSEVPVDRDGILRRPDFQGDIAERVRRISRYLGQPPQIIGGQPQGVHMLMEMLVAPVIDTISMFDTPPHELAAVVPAHWPDYIVDYFVDALERTGLLVIPVRLPDALASFSETISMDGAITCLDLGANSGSITISVPNGEHRIAEVHIADPKAGQATTDRHLVGTIAPLVDPAFQPDNKWLAKAVNTGRTIRRATRKATNRTDLIEARLPEPLSKVKIVAGQINDFVEDLVGRRLEALAADEDVVELLNEDEANGIPRQLLVAGGFSTDRSVGTAIRTRIGPWKAQRGPETIAAQGAARWVATGRHREQ